MSPFSYSILRVVPSVERGEQLNVGVVLFCRQLNFLALRAQVDPDRLQALYPAAPLPELTAHLEGLIRVAAGDPAAGAIAILPPSERFGWLAAPASTMIQASPVHTGLCEDPQATLDGLFARLVAAPAPD
jgi:hypothetical protein